MTELNLRTIRALAETLVENPLDHMEWLVGCSKQNNLAKCLVFFIILQALVSCKDFAKLSGLFEACFSALKNEWFEMLFVDNGVLASKFLKEEWCEVESHCTVIIVGELNMKRFDKAYLRLANQLLHSDADMLSKKILISVNWCLLEKFTTVARANKLLKDQHLLLLDQLFLFFSASSSINIFKKQLPVVVMNCCEAPFNFLSKYFVEEGFSSEVQAESLFAFASLSSLHSSDRRSTNESTLLPLLMFPSLLVPLTSANKVIRTAAVNCVEGIYKLFLNCDVSRLNKGDDVIFLQCVSTPNFGNFLESILNQKRLILSDANFLPSFLTSMLSSASDSLLVPDNSHKRFSQPYKDAVLRFILTSALKFPSYGKQKVLSFLKAMGNALLQVEGCKELLLGLFEKRDEYYIESGKLVERLSETEIDTLCLLLELCTLQLTSSIDDVCISCLLKALKVDSLLLDQPSITKPCITVLKNLTSTFYIILDSNIQISCPTIVRSIEEILSRGQHIDSKRVKRKKSTTLQSLNNSEDLFESGGNIIFLLGSLLDILLLKKDIAHRYSLVQPLFEVLDKLFSNDWLGLSSSGSVSEFSETFSASIYHTQHSTLLILKEIIDSLIVENPAEVNLCKKLNINLLVECTLSVKDITTRNHIFSLLTSVAKISSEWLSEHIVRLFHIVGESTVKQSDHHSQQVLENLISVLVPCWLAKTNSVGKLFQIFVEGLPGISEHGKMTIMLYLLRMFGEKDNLGILYYHLFRSLALRLKESSFSESVFCELFSTSSLVDKEWEYIFALQLCNQYSSKIWLPSLLTLLKEVEICSKGREYFLELFLALQFIFAKLRDTEFVFELESGRDASYGQATLGALMEQVVLHLQLIGVRCKQLGFSSNVVKEVRKDIHQILKTLTTWMRPDRFFRSIGHLLDSDDDNVIAKVLMQTRSEQVRPKIVGLKVIQYLVEHLREEYLVFMPETIPFLGELLEDIELPVKTLAQEILRMMEALSGESLKEYL